MLVVVFENVVMGVGGSGGGVHAAVVVVVVVVGEFSVCDGIYG